jgi:hypothetical protein
MNNTSTKITDAFVEWWKTSFCKKMDLQHQFIELEFTDDKYIKENLFTVLWANDEGGERYGNGFTFGTIDNMRKEWFKYNEDRRKKYEEDEDDHEDESWNAYITGTFKVDEVIYFVAEDWR